MHNRSTSKLPVVEPSTESIRTGAIHPGDRTRGRLCQRRDQLVCAYGRLAPSYLLGIGMVGLALALSPACSDTRAANKISPLERVSETELPVLSGVRADSMRAQVSTARTSTVVDQEIGLRARPTPSDPEPREKKPESYRELFRAGTRLSTTGDYAGAVAALSLAVETAPKRGPAHLALARAYLASGDFQRARQPAETAVELLPKSSSAWNALGRVELAESKTDAAIASFQRATAENGDNSYAWNNLGFVYINLERFEDAAAALELATGGARPQPYMWNNLATAYERLHKLDEARAAYRQAKAAGSTKAQESLARLQGVASLDNRLAADDQQDETRTAGANDAIVIEDSQQ